MDFFQRDACQAEISNFHYRTEHPEHRTPRTSESALSFIKATKLISEELDRNSANVLTCINFFSYPFLFQRCANNFKFRKYSVCVYTLYEGPQTT